MNVLSLSFDQALLRSRVAALNESQRRQVNYVEELRRRVPGSRLWIVVRAAPGITQRPVAIGDGLKVIPARSSTVGFILTACLHGRQLCRQHGFDLLTSQSPFSDGLVAWLLRSWCGARWLAQLHTSTLDNPYWLSGSGANRVRSDLGKFLLRRADGVRVVSRSAAAWLHQEVGLPREKVFVLAVGTSLVGKTVPSIEASDAAEQVLFVGRLTAEKGTSVLIHAFARLKGRFPDAELVLVGDGPAKQSLQELAQSLGLCNQIRFVGWVPYDELAPFYVNARVVAVPSLHESYGRVIVEAMSFGRPVVASDTEGARELIRHEQTGFIVPTSDVAAMADRIEHLLANPGVAAEVGAKARQFIMRTHDPRALCEAQVEMWLQVARQ
jgi:glycosyltransferase involved in cell wall biosynthesis